MLEIKEDIRDECAKVGTVTNVVLYDQETDGVASVRYSTVEAANACVRVIIKFFHLPNSPTHKPQITFPFPTSYHSLALPFFSLFTNITFAL